MSRIFGSKTLSKKAGLKNLRVVLHERELQRKFEAGEARRLAAQAAANAKAAANVAANAKAKANAEAANAAAAEKAAAKARSAQLNAEAAARRKEKPLNASRYPIPTRNTSRMAPGWKGSKMARNVKSRLRDGAPLPKEHFNQFSPEVQDKYLGNIGRRISSGQLNKDSVPLYLLEQLAA